MEQTSTKNEIKIVNRERMTLGGVIDIDSYDESSIVLATELGTLILKGENFRINKLNVDTGELDIEGILCSLAYSDNGRKKGESLISRIFK